MTDPAEFADESESRIIAQLHDIHALSDHQFQSIVEVLNAPKLAKRRDLEVELLHATGLEETVVEDIVQLSIGFANAALTSFDYPDRDLGNRLATQSPVGLDDDGRAVLGARLDKLIHSKSIEYYVRANSAASDFDRLYESASISTELRQVFDHEGNGIAVVPWHSFKLQTEEAGGSNAPLTVVLDHHDLVQLRGMIDRALQQQLGSQDIARRSGLQIWDPFSPSTDIVEA